MPCILRLYKTTSESIKSNRNLKMKEWGAFLIKLHSIDLISKLIWDIPMSQTMISEFVKNSHYAKCLSSLNI